MSMCCVQRIRDDTLKEWDEIKGTNGRVGEGGTTSLEEEENLKGKGGGNEWETGLYSGLPPNAEGARGENYFLGEWAGRTGGRFSRGRVT